jgi:hypothetical protein
MSGMGEPLSKSQKGLRGRDLRTMSIEQLQDWIHACNAMEKWVNYNKARRTWTQSRREAQELLNKRQRKLED